MERPHVVIAGAGFGGLWTARALAGQALDVTLVDRNNYHTFFLAVIGRNAAVAYVAGRSFRGLAAWVLWLVIHVAKLIGFRKRALVLVNWAWNYVFYRRAVRLILPTVRESDAHGEQGPDG